ncbi:hypothetical protein AGMMS49991_11850 [Spirochaetia bacterium]|nr:hypothetical protein AGMMS49991_11850 [Spirochaetia bacterium]
MKLFTRFFVVVLTVILMFNVSCSNTPSWAKNATPKDVVRGIGSANNSNEALSRSIAESRARASIVRQLNTELETMLTDYKPGAGTTGNRPGIVLTESISRQVSSLQLTNTRVVKKWRAPDGTWWYMLEITKADARALLQPIVDAVLLSK